jgi:hypothetical protein
MIDDKKAPTKIYSQKNSLLIAFVMVFSDWRYVLVSAVITSVFWIIFSVFDQLLFFSPIVVFYLPDDAVIGFILSTITSVLLGIVASMNVYLLKHSKVKVGLASFFSGSTLGFISSTCASCSSLGFLLVSTLGGAGVVASSFMSNYQTPLRLVSILLLIWALYSISNKLTMSCAMNQQALK